MEKRISVALLIDNHIHLAADEVILIPDLLELITSFVHHVGRKGIVVTTVILQQLIYITQNIIGIPPQPSKGGEFYSIVSQIATSVRR